MKKIDTKFLKPEDFIINVRPQLDSKRAWTGQVEINIMSSKENGLTHFDNEALFHLCTCMSALVPMMELDKDLLYEIEDFIKEMKKKDTRANDKLTVQSKVGNVITLDFKSDTEGSA